MMPPASYQPHEILVAPARPSRALWRLVLGFLLAGAAYLALAQVFFQTAYSLAGGGGLAFFERMMSGQSPAAMYLLLFSFGLMIAGVAMALRVVHRRSLAGLLGPRALFVRQFGVVTVALLLLGVVILLLPPWGMGGELIPNLPFGRWFLLLPLSLLAVLVQVSAEEIVFRGYLQQQLAARFNSPVIWMAVPSVVFAMGHYLPEAAGPNALMVALWAGIFGMLMADLTARAGSLGPAIAAHFVNNITAILVVSLPDDLSGLSLYLTPFSMADAEAMRGWLPVDFALMFVSWLAARLALRR